MYLSIIFLPLLGSVVSGFFGRKSGITGSHIISSSSVIITTILAIIAFFEIGFNNNSVSISLFEWLRSESFNIVWNFQFDSLTVSMLIPVLIISSVVHIYSIGYMSSDPHNQRFFSYLNLFTFMMILLVTGNNYLLMFVGWEGVGVCSYLLISFWFTRIAANQSSISAFLTNRVGDCFLVIGMLTLLWTLGNLDYSTIFSLAPYVNANVVTIIGICLLLGAMAKSAQIGLHVWLPMAMEGPTPVSALIHAATMVTAGVYLLIRSSPLIEYSSTLLLICLWLGAVTTLASSMIGLFQGDIKKIIAYSTMSQLGMMVIAIGLSSYNVALFHLINHAFYKGLLFLGAGSVIHAVADNQDLRKYGGLIHWLPLTYSVILIASLSLVAFPFMTGFYSKDLILESAYGQYQFPGIAAYFIAVVGAIFTTLYSVKILYLAFIANPNGSLNYYKNAHEGNIFMSLPLVILAIFSIYFGYLTKDIYVGLGSGFFNNNSIFIHPIHEVLISAEFGLSTIIKLLPFIFTILATTGAIIILEFYPALINNFKLSNLGYNIFGFFNQRLLIELFYNKYIVNLTLKLGGQTTKVLDRGSIELVGPFGAEKLLLFISKVVSGLSTGMVTNYALFIIIGVIVYLLGGNFYLFNINNVLLLSILIVSIVVTMVQMRNINSLSPIVLESNILNGRSIFNKLILKTIMFIIAFIVSIFTGLDKVYHLDSDDEGNQPESSRDAERRAEQAKSRRLADLAWRFEVERYANATGLEYNEAEEAMKQDQEAREAKKKEEEAAPEKEAEGKAKAPEYNTPQSPQYNTEQVLQQDASSQAEQSNSQILPAPGEYVWYGETNFVQSDDAGTDKKLSRLQRMLLKFNSDNLAGMDKDIKEDNLHTKSEVELKKEDAKLLEEREKEADFVREFSQKLDLEDLKKQQSQTEDAEMEDSNDKKRSNEENSDADKRKKRSR